MTVSTGATPTVVLVHGAFADSSSWNGVIARLRDDGYPVIAVANPLRDLHGDAEFLRSVLDSVDGPIVVAGHSYGGSVLSEAADRKPEVRALVYVASFLLDEGESTGELAGRFPGNELGPALRPVPVSGPDGRTVDDLYIQQERFREVFAADVPPHVADLMAVTQRPIVADALEGKAARAAWKTVPSWTMVTLNGVPATTDMHVRNGAVACTYLGQILVMMADKGIVGLDDELSRYLPPFYEDSTFWDSSWTAPTGAVTTTDITDLARSAQAVGSGRLVSPDLREQEVGYPLTGVGRTTEQCPVCNALTDTRSYGLGVVLLGDWITQTKSFGGSGASIGYLPEEELSIAVITTITPDGFDADGRGNPASDAVMTDVAQALTDNLPVGG